MECLPVIVTPDPSWPTSSPHSNGELGVTMEIWRKCTSCKLGFISILPPTHHLIQLSSQQGVVGLSETNQLEIINCNASCK